MHDKKNICNTFESITAVSLARGQEISNAQKAVLQALPSSKLTYWLISRECIYELYLIKNTFWGSMPSALQSHHVQLLGFVFEVNFQFALQQT